MRFLRAPEFPLADPLRKDGSRGDPTAPPASPWRLLAWLASRNKGLAISALVTSGLALGSLPVLPYFLTGAVDGGLRERDWGALAFWSGAMVVAGFLSAGLIVVSHRLTVYWRMDASYRTLQLATRKVNRLGDDLRRRLTTGEVVSVGATDINRISWAIDSLSPTAGCLVGLIAVGVLLFNTSVGLGLTIFIGVFIVGLITGPVLNKLQDRQEDYRERVGDITGRASDIVSGLRVLRGIGGEARFTASYRRDSEALREAGYKVAAPQAWLNALGEGTPAILLGVVIWIAARQVAAGDLTPGQMVAAFGYTSALLLPVHWLIGCTYRIIEGRVAAGKVCELLNTPEREAPAEVRPGPAAGAELHDPESGLTVEGGELLAVASAESDLVARAFDRLGGYTESEARFGDVPVAALDRDELHRRVLVADHDAYLFAGTLAAAIAARDGADRVEAAVAAASAADVVESLPDGLDSALDNQARTLSGGQRQRLRLARAIAAAPEALLLHEPTSAVDSHTEARIVDRLAEARAGLATAVATTSPLWLGRADRVAFVQGGKVIATGTHHELAAEHPDYRALVSREEA
ncbi:ABC-type multidrug transport system, ATPase and permease component [Glycomyces sambucus]|uniref:ABC-type multidrug transport system, ATPase and permease component n=1 Tax=Glycomyces sambucus TaxID=380244 RepID=A0A1G9MNC3_9ACTN|nr:ABC transporter ATP-binding protein [Glycomyces sambucus]SDL75155.1 ABC-type multidrug transport system, ATPase and permease component [Glycomyces sambucus]